MAEPRHAFIHLEMLRGVAALLVLLGHLRSFLMQSYAELGADDGPPGVLVSGFYFLTSLGMPAVMIFFALSGFLISRSIDDALAAGRWSPWGYASARLARLWTVLIPALLLTAFWDTLAQVLADPGFYRAEHYLRYASGPRPGEWPQSTSLATWLQNALFLQTITAPTYGSNIPLWSLAQEFWYYLLFPLGYLAAGRLPQRHASARVAGATLLAIALLTLPAPLLWGGVIWLCGVLGGCVLRNAARWPRLTGTPGLIGGAAMLAAGVLLPKAQWIGARPGDLLIGLGCVALLPALARRQDVAGADRRPRYARLARSLSGVSYTLYLAHFPLLAFIAAVVLDNRRLAPTDPLAITAFIALFALTLAYTYALHALFERRTPAVRAWLRRLPHTGPA